MIISPEFGERVDPRQTDARVDGSRGPGSRDLPELAAVTHHKIEHPHVHVPLRGVDGKGLPLQINRDYIDNGIREVAEDL